MLAGLDHIVIAVRDLERATEDYKNLGFTVVPGGRHPVGTYNGLIAFVDGSYIELISFYRDNPEHRWWAALQKREGLVDFCFRTDDLAGDTAKLRRAGVKIEDPVPWSRTRPDGYQLKWLLSLAVEPHRGVAPFLIEDVTPREERVPRDVDHPNGVTGIGALLVAVDDLPAVERWYEAVLGTTDERIVRKNFKADAAEFHIGPHLLVLLAPKDRSGPVAEWLRGNGPSPFAATLRGNKKIPPMDSKLTHGAALWSA
ncbi:MAG TPA: VOC family protein [Candidatus Binatia bacterium]|jgi:catechol 2,3-dioxygenase-like lactoylglutathione lyase family enzyme